MKTTHIVTDKKQSVPEIITGKFLAFMQENKQLPWVKPWKAIGFYNIVSKRHYRGINVLMLALFGDDTAFLTRNQIFKNGGSIKKGAKSIPVVYWNWLDKKDKSGKTVYKANGEPEKIPFLRYYPTFAYNQTEGLNLKRIETKQSEFKPVELAEKMIAAANIPTRFGSNQAAYTPSLHGITLPNRESFATVEQYYCTHFHEIGHALHKEVSKIEVTEAQSTIFGSESYSKEELVAELFANFCLSYCGIDSEKAFVNSAAYLQNWMKALSSDPKLIVQAAAQAQKRFDWIVEKLTGQKPGEAEETDTGDLKQ